MKLPLLLILILAITIAVATAGCWNSKQKFTVKIAGKNRKKKCNWVGKNKANRCRKKTVDGTPIKDICRKHCNNCPSEAPVPSPTSAPDSGKGCCTLDYKECINWCGDTEESCSSCSNNDVGWIPNGPPSGSCNARWIACGNDKNSCCDGLTCQDDGNGYFSCLPGDSTPTPPSPTNPPQPSPTKPPQPNPTNAPVPPPVAPVPSPTNAPNGNGCCSLDYKNCVGWCGSTFDSCMSCSNNEVVWLSNGPGDTCGERWSGCGQDNDNNHSGCCDGLTCQWRDGHDYFACLPGGDGTPTPPQPSPTKPPQSSPVAPPTDSGGDWVSGKATFYGGNPSGGACGYNDLPQVTFPKGFSVAVGGDLFDDGYGCGACFEVTCDSAFGSNPNCLCGQNGQNKVIVQATDQCPECASNHFDLNAAAFTSIVKDQDPSMAGTCGIINTSYRRVSCDFKSNIKIRSKSGTSGHWYGLHIDDVAGYGAIKSVKLREASRRQNGQWDFDIVCRKSEGASFWLCDRPNGREIFANLDVMLEDSAGRILKSKNVIKNLRGNQEFDFGKNFGPIDSEPTQPTKAPVAQPSAAPVVQPTAAPAPTTPFNGELFSTDKAMNAWEVYQGLDYITHKNSENPPNYALVAS